MISNGIEDYTMNKSKHFEIEKNFKIKSVEKIRKLKEEHKDLKLKVNEIEDELVNQEKITLKSLQALCMVHNTIITYVFGRKYVQFAPLTTNDDTSKGIIVLNNKKDETLKFDMNNEYMTYIKENYWKIDNIHKPLNCAGVYSVKDLQDICTKLEIPLNDENNKKKNKTVLYEEILKTL
jgi:hypothetical protein